MPKPDVDQIVADGNKLQTDRFSKRDAWLKARIAERFNETTVDVPLAYRTTGHQPTSSILEEEAHGIATLVHADPVPHITPGSPEDQPLTTMGEKFLMAWNAETQAVFGPTRWQGTLAQIHDNISWEYVGWRKVPYRGQPKSPEDLNNLTEMDAFTLKSDRFKKNAGVKSYCDRRHVATNTAYPVGNVYDPDRFYEIKQVPERDLLDTYGITKNQDGSYTKKTEDATTTPSGYASDKAGSEMMIKVTEYWDRDWCVIVAEQTKTKLMGLRQVKTGFLLDEWQHNWGRVPYFARPARITDQMAEERRFAGPLDPVHTEMPFFKRIAAMTYAVAYQTAFSPQVIETEREGEVVMDDNGAPKVFLQFTPGEARQLAPGQKVHPLGQSPEVANLFQEKMAAQARIEHFTLSPVAKGVSPGADTANAALSNLHRYQLSTLDPLAQQAARQDSAEMRFVLERIKAGKDRYFVFDSETDTYLSLGPDDVISVNVTAKVTPDQGQFQLLIEKHAAELKQLGLITLQEMYEMWGKENPEEYVLELKAEKLAESLEPVVNQQIISDLGMLDAVNAMIQQNAQSGDARNAVPGLMGQVQEMNTGQGTGAAGAPRDAGVRSPVVSETTQPQLEAGGY